MRGKIAAVLGGFILLIGLVCIFTYPETPATTFDRFIDMIQSFEEPPPVLNAFGSLEEELFDGGFFSGVVDLAKVTLSLLSYPIRFIIWLVKFIYALMTFFFVGGTI